MKTKDLRKKPTHELEKQVHELRDKLRQLRFDLPAGKVKNVKQIRATRRTVAQILTILKEQK